MTDVYNQEYTFYTFEEFFFVTDYYGNPPTNFSSLVKVWYFSITTLTTIGYGDFRPISVYEKIATAILLLFAVAIFSYIMGTFIDILKDFRNLEKFNDHKNLTKWIAMLSKYNNGVALKRQLILDIEEFFTFYWENNRLQAFISESGERFMSELPESTIQNIYLDYLFQEFIYRYKSWFRIEINGRLQKISED